MKLSAAQIKEMTGCKTRALGESTLYSRLEAETWLRGYSNSQRHRRVSAL